MSRVSRFSEAVIQPQHAPTVNVPTRDKTRPRLYKPANAPEEKVAQARPMSKYVPMSYFAGLVAGLLAVGLLHLWRLLYPVGDHALLLLLVIALLIWRGTYMRTLIRRMAWRRAILRQDSWLFRIFQGRFMAHVAGFMAAVLGTFALADFALTASVREGMAAIGLSLLTGLVLAFAARWAALHARRDLVLVVAGPVTAAIMGLIGTVTFFYIGWYLEPAPTSADAATLGAAIRDAQTALPARDHIVAWALGIPRSLETAGWVFAAQSQSLGFSPFGLAGLLLYNALVSFSLVRLVVDIVTSADRARA